MSRRSSGPPLLAGLLVAAFFLLLLAKNPLLCWKDDFAISIMPVFADAARAWRHGEWPLLSPYSWSCGNLAGEYQYGTFSPVVNLAAVAVDFLPVGLPARAAALALSQLVLLAMGACILAKRQPGGSAGGGVLVAVVAALNGWNVAWSATDWFGSLAANAWLPWCWWAFAEALAEPKEEESAARWWWRRGLLPAGCVYLLVTGGFPYTVAMLALLTVWLAIRAWVSNGRRVRPLWPLASGWLLGVGLGAPALLSLFAYIPGSDRAHGVNVIAGAWCVPWRGWAGLVLPSLQATWRDFAGLPLRRPSLELAGGLVPLALLAGACGRAGWRQVGRRCGWELGLLAGVFLLCMLPSPGLFRWSFRWLPLFFLTLAVTAVRADGVVGERDGWKGRWAGNAGVWAAVMVGVGWVGVRLQGGGAFLPGWTLLLALGWAAGVEVAGRGASADAPGKMPGTAGETPTLPGSLPQWLAAGVAMVSLWLVYGELSTNPDVPVYAIGTNILKRAPLSVERLYLGLYLEPYLRYRAWQTGPDFGAVLRPGSTFMFAGIHFINGYSPIMSAAVGRRLEMETHGCIPEKVGAALLAAGSAGDALLARLGVDGVIISTDYPLAAPPPEAVWERVYASPEGSVYHRRGGLLPPIQVWGGEAAVAEVVERRQSVSAQVNVAGGGRPARLVFRRPFFAGYRATWNGREVRVGSADGYQPTVDLPAGARGRLELIYRPPAVVIGAVVAACSAGVLAAIGLSGGYGSRGRLN